MRVAQNILVWGPLAAAMLSACSPQPEVSYSLITRPEDLTGQEHDKYCLQKSVLVFSAPPADSNFPPSVIAMPREKCDAKVALTAASSSIGVSTNINISKLDNSDIVREIGIEVKDDRVKYIQEIGGAVVAAASIVMLTADQELPAEIDTYAQMEGGGVQRGERSVTAPGGVTLGFRKLPPDAFNFPEQFPNAKISSQYIYSACRDVVVSFTHRGTQYQKILRISDPRYFQTIAFPVKGKITSHSSCGVSVVSEKDTGVSSDAAVAAALIQQAKSLSSATANEKPNPGSSKAN